MQLYRHPNTSHPNQSILAIRQPTSKDAYEKKASLQAWSIHKLPVGFKGCIMTESRGCTDGAKHRIAYDLSSWNNTQHHKAYRVTQAPFTMGTLKLVPRKPLKPPHHLFYTFKSQSHQATNTNQYQQVGHYLTSNQKLAQDSCYVCVDGEENFESLTWNSDDHSLDCFSDRQALQILTFVHGSSFLDRVSNQGHVKLVPRLETSTTMIAYLAYTEGNVEFHEVINFLHEVIFLMGALTVSRSSEPSKLTLKRQSAQSSKGKLILETKEMMDEDKETDDVGLVLKMKFKYWLRKEVSTVMNNWKVMMIKVDAVLRDRLKVPEDQREEWRVPRSNSSVPRQIPPVSMLRA
ncbi:hypothetical protein Tco_0010676 [Tanacetum coccineum]